MTRSDGKVVISTKLDNAGLEKGLSNVSGSLGGLKSVLGKVSGLVAAAFSVKAIVQFGAEASKAAMELSDAFTGLQSILDRQGRSFSNAKSFIEEYTQDGLIPATNAIKAYKNLAMRGYDDSQIRSVMTALKDASAYGRQANYTMGEAVESATEGLKNENSVLVDNAGVTKNVAKMWEDYAKSIGTTANNLTQQQKIQAEVNGILEESRYQTGDAAKVAGTLSGRLQQLSFSFNNLKVAVGNIVNPIVNALLPALNAGINAITIFANKLASLVGGIFGPATSHTESVAESALEAAEAEEALASGIGAARKEAKKSLANFDELNILQNDMGASGGGAVGTGAVNTPIIAPEITTTPIDEAADAIKKKLSGLAAWFESSFSPSIEAWEDAFSPMAEAWGGASLEIGQSLNRLWNEDISPFGSYVTNDWIPQMVNAFSTTFAPVLRDVMPAAMEGFTIDFENGCKVVSEALGILQSGFEGAKTVFSDMCSSFSKHWEKHSEKLTQGFVEFKQGLWDTFWRIYDSIVKPVIDGIGQTFNWLWEQHLKPLWDNIVSFALSTQENILNLWNGFLKPVIDWLVEVLAPIVRNVVSGVRDAVAIVIAAISDNLRSLLTILNGVITFITGVFTLDWNTAWEGISGIFEGVLDSLETVAKSAVNAVIYCINRLISSIYSSIRSVVNGIGGIVSNIGRILGRGNWGFSMPSYTPQIPYLAKGAVLPANKPFMAMVGDQKHGTNIEAPLSTIQEAVAAVIGDYTSVMTAGFEASVQKQQEILDAIMGIEIGDTTIGQAAMRHQRRQNYLNGGGAL